MISIVTPWSGDTLDLMTDYDTATMGAQLVIVDNASGAATAEGLRGLPADRGIVMHNTTNRGFAAAVLRAAAIGGAAPYQIATVVTEHWLPVLSEIAEDIRVPRSRGVLRIIRPEEVLG